MENNNTENKYIKTIKIIQQIGRTGCGRIKCKMCPLEPACDRVAVNAKDNANKWLAEIYKKK
jgi:hypothetical protein